ncbi:MAG: inositol monophosphatase [Patescibacteria group bacterium]
MKYQKELDLAKDLAEKAGKIMHKYFNAEHRKTVKRDGSFVTAADTEANDMVIDEIEKHFPDHGIIGEEASRHAGEDYTWICDPIDGTLQFTLGVPVSVFAIGLMHQGKMLMSVIYNPFTDDLAWAVKGEGAYLNDKKISVSECHDLNGAIIDVFGASKYFNKYEFFGQERKNYKLIPSGIYSGLYGGMLVACGRIDGAIFNMSPPHDSAMAQLLVEEAGGVATNLVGRDQRYDKPVFGMIAGNKTMHKKLKDLVEPYLESDQ